MTLLPRFYRHLLGALGLALIGCLPLAHAISAQAAELEGTPVPIESADTGAADAIAPASSAAAPDAQPAPIAAPAPIASPAHEPPDHHRHGDWEREFEMGLKHAFGEGHDDEANYKGAFELAMLIPILAVIFIFGGPIFLVALLIVQRYRARAVRQQSINSNIDKLLAAGRDIPVELLRGDEPKGADDNSNRSKGIRNICLGAGWAIFLTILAGIDIGAIGFIWIALGISQVLIWYLNQPKAGQPLAPQVEQQD